MEDILFNWLTDMGFRKIDLVFMVILFWVRRNDIKAIRALRAKYERLNTLVSNHAWIIRLKLGVQTIRQHREGDFEIVEAIDEVE